MLLCFLGGVGYGLWQLVVHPETPLPDAWNPTRPLDLQAEITPVTRWQFRQALESAESCQAALETGAAALPLPDFEASEQCHIRPQVTVSAVAGMTLAPVNTRCQTALRLAMWARHGIAPAAEATVAVLNTPTPRGTTAWRRERSSRERAIFVVFM